MSAKKVKVKVKKKKLKIKNILVTLLILLIIVLISIDITRLPVKNIYINGNNILNDKTIIELAELTDYPPYINTYFNNIKEKLLDNDYIKNVKIKRTLSRKIYIEIEEYNPICIYNNKLVLSSTKSVDNIYNVNYVPYVIDIDNIHYREFLIPQIIIYNPEHLRTVLAYMFGKRELQTVINSPSILKLTVTEIVEREIFIRSRGEDLVINGVFNPIFGWSKTKFSQELEKQNTQRRW